MTKYTSDSRPKGTISFSYIIKRLQARLMTTVSSSSLFQVASYLAQLNGGDCSFGLCRVPVTNSLSLSLSLPYKHSNLFSFSSLPLSNVGQSLGNVITESTLTAI